MRYFYYVIFCFLWGTFSFTKDFGQQHNLKKTSREFIAEYIKGIDYDISAYIQKLKIKKVSRHVLRFSLLVPQVKEGDYLSINFYDPLNKKLLPLVDLSKDPDDPELVEKSSEIFFRAYNKNNEIFWAPVILKNGFKRVKANHQEEYHLFFDQQSPVKNWDGQIVGEKGDVLTHLMAHYLGRGTNLFSHDLGYIITDDEGWVNFDLFLNPTRRPFFMIIAFDHISLQKSKRGLRSVIQTPVYS